MPKAKHNPLRPSLGQLNSEATQATHGGNAVGYRASQHLVTKKPPRRHGRARSRHTRARSTHHPTARVDIPVMSR